MKYVIAERTATSQFISMGDFAFSAYQTQQLFEAYNKRNRGSTIFGRQQSFEDFVISSAYTGWFLTEYIQRPNACHFIVSNITLNNLVFSKDENYKMVIFKNVTFIECDFSDYRFDKEQFVDCTYINKAKAIETRAPTNSPIHWEEGYLDDLTNQLSSSLSLQGQPTATISNATMTAFNSHNYDGAMHF